MSVNRSHKTDKIQRMVGSINRCQDYEA